MSHDVERRLPPVFPAKRTLFSGRRVSVADLVAMDQLVGDQSPVASYLVAEGDGDALYLLFRKGRVYSAGRHEEGRLESLSVREWMAHLLDKSAGERTFDLFEVDPAVLLLIAVHFQKRPQLSVTTDLANPEEILGKVEAGGVDAVIAIVDGALRHVVFCKAGRPARFHVAGEIAVPDEDSLAESITVFCFDRGSARTLALEVYDDLEVAPAADHGLELTRYAATGGSAPRYQLALYEGSNHVETRVFHADRCVIGRGRDCDLRLDDNAVSRAHAVIEWRRGDLVLRDIDSDNGTQLNGEALLGQHTLRAGDEVRVGRTRLVFKLLPRSGRSAAEDTVHLDPGIARERVVYLGKVFDVPAGGLIIGAGVIADIRIRGPLVRERQVHIFRDDEGRFWLEHLGGWRRVLVNDRAVRRCALETGDLIRLAGERMRFYNTD